MKYLNMLIKSILSMGLLGLVIALMAVIILFVSIIGQPDSFFVAQEQMVLLNELEGDIRDQLVQMQLSEAYHAYWFEYDEPGEGDDIRAQEADAEITALLQDLEDAGYFDPDRPYGQEINEELQAFNDLRLQHRETFDRMVTAYQGGDFEQAQQLLSELQDENEELNYQLQAMINYAEQGRLEALNAFPQEANWGIIASTVSFIVLLILALIGYLQVSAITRPLNRLRNAVTAIGGDQYRSELLEGYLRKAGPAGDLARALDRLAKMQDNRTFGEKAEIERLRTELYQSRRRRLRLFRDSEKRSEQA